MSKSVNTGNRRNQRRRHRAQKTRFDKGLSTTDHDTIKKWIMERGGKPVVERGLCDEIRMLYIHFPDSEDIDRKTEELSWEDFFTLFEQNDLEFLYQEKTLDGKQSRFGKFVSRIS
jgi:hypothetical protein